MNIDLSIIKWVQDFFGPNSGIFWEVITNLGSAPLLVLTVGLVVWLSGTRNGLRVLFAFMLSTVTVLLFKALLVHPRPYYIYEEVQPWRDTDGLGMPSGHAGGSMALWGTLAHSVRHQWLLIVAPILIFLIGISRIYFGVHSPSQVLVGWVIGLFFVAIIWRYEEKAVAFFKSLGLWRQLGLALATTLMLIGVKLFVLSALAANNPVPQAWQERYQAAQSYEVNLAGLDASEFEQLQLFGELGIDLIGAFFGMWLVLIYVANRRGFGDYSGKQRVINVVLGLLGLAIMIGLTEFFEGNWPVEIALWSALPVVLGVGVPLVGRRFG